MWDKTFCLRCFLKQRCSNSYLQNQIIVLQYWQFVPHALPFPLSSPWYVIFLSCCCRYWYKLGNNSLAYQHWLLVLWAMWSPNFKHGWASRGATASAFGLMLLEELLRKEMRFPSFSWPKQPILDCLEEWCADVLLRMKATYWAFSSSSNIVVIIYCYQYHYISILISLC